MSIQPEALRLAAWMDDMPSVIPGNDSNEWHNAAAELRRLHAANIDCVNHFNATLDEIAAKIEQMPFGDTAASFAVWIRGQKV